MQLPVSQVSSDLLNCSVATDRRTLPAVDPMLVIVFLSSRHRGYRDSRYYCAVPSCDAVIGGGAHYGCPASVGLLHLQQLGVVFDDVQEDVVDV